MVKSYLTVVGSATANEASRSQTCIPPRIGIAGGSRETNNGPHPTPNSRPEGARQSIAFFALLARVDVVDFSVCKSARVDSEIAQVALIFQISVARSGVVNGSGNFQGRRSVVA